MPFSHLTGLPEAVEAYYAYFWTSPAPASSPCLMEIDVPEYDETSRLAAVRAYEVLESAYTEPTTSQMSSHLIQYPKRVSSPISFDPLSDTSESLVAASPRLSIQSKDGYQRHRRSSSMAQPDPVLSSSTSLPNMSTTAGCPAAQLTSSRSDMAPGIPSSRQRRIRAASYPVVRFAEERNTFHTYETTCDEHIPAWCSIPLNDEDDGNEMEEESTEETEDPYPFQLESYLEEEERAEDTRQSTFDENNFYYQTKEELHRCRSSSLSDLSLGCTTPPLNAECAEWIARVPLSESDHRHQAKSLSHARGHTTTSSQGSLRSLECIQPQPKILQGLAITVTAPLEGLHRSSTFQPLPSLFPAEFNHPSSNALTRNQLEPSPAISNDGGYHYTPLEAVFDWDHRHSPPGQASASASNSRSSTLTASSLSSYSPSPRPDLFHYQPPKQCFDSAEDKSVPTPQPQLREVSRFRTQQAGIEHKAGQVGIGYTLPKQSKRRRSVFEAFRKLVM